MLVVAGGVRIAWDHLVLDTWTYERGNLHLPTPPLFHFEVGVWSGVRVQTDMSSFMKWKAVYFVNENGDLLTDDPTVFNKNRSRDN